jgi:toxin YoeB
MRHTWHVLSSNIAKAKSCNAAWSMSSEQHLSQLTWTQAAWEDYEYWQGQDKKTLKRINALIKDVMRHPFVGIGKPEPLKANLSGFWSRRHRR